MRFRTYKNTDLRVSEVGFGLWTISTGWWGQFTEGEAIALMHKAFDLGVTLFDAADTYGNGLSEELIAKAFPKQRDEIVIATKVGYDFVTHGETRGRGQREIPQDFSPEAIVRATDAALKRLKTDRIDLLQLHNIRMEQIYDDAIWTTLEKLKVERENSVLGHCSRAGRWVALRRHQLHSGTRGHQRATHLQHAGATSRPGHARRRNRSWQGHHVSHSRHAFLRHARREIHCGDNVPADRSSQPSSAELALEWREKNRPNFAFSKAPIERSARRRCNGSSKTSASPPRCQTFTKKRSSSNSRKHPIVRRSRVRSWKKSRSFTPIISAWSGKSRSSKVRWKLPPRPNVPRSSGPQSDSSSSAGSGRGGRRLLPFVFCLYRSFRITAIIGAACDPP